jgi:peroxiredoxin
MSKLENGQKMVDFEFNTAAETGLKLSNAASGKKTILLFLRYYGCTACQLDMLLLREKYAEVEAQNAEALVVLQSKPEIIIKETENNAYPFKIICDPNEELYKQFDIKAAKNKLELAGGKSIFKIAEIKKHPELSHGEYEGEELQLPAVFILDTGFTIRFAHYAKNLGDMPSIDEMITVLKRI